MIRIDKRRGEGGNYWEIKKINDCGEETRDEILTSVVGKGSG
jgi:hypothetical protein